MLKINKDLEDQCWRIMSNLLNVEARKQQVEMWGFANGMWKKHCDETKRTS